MTVDRVQYITLCSEIQYRDRDAVLVMVTCCQPVLSVQVVIGMEHLTNEGRGHSAHVLAVQKVVQATLPYLRGKRFVYREFLSKAMQQVTGGTPSDPVYIHFNVDANSPSYCG